MRLFAAVALVVLLAAGCGGAAQPRSSAKFPVLVAHPKLQTTGIPNADASQIRQNGALLLSRSQVAFMTSGTTSCVWLPTRMTVISPSSITIDMRVNGSIPRCSSGAVGFPIAVRIDPTIVDVTQPVTVTLAYEVFLPVPQGTKHWNRTVVAPPFSGS
jgi:hypothetical protein